MKKQFTIISPPKSDVLSVYDTSDLITSWNKMIESNTTHILGIDMTESLRKELVERNIITEDHEGPIDVS